MPKIRCAAFAFSDQLPYVYVIRLTKTMHKDTMYHKTDEFDAALQDIAAIAKALSHPARLAILKHLSEQKSCYSGNIADELPLSRTTVSQHLQELRRAGLIEGEIDGTRICYCINTEVYSRSRALIEAFFTDLHTLQCCTPASAGDNCCTPTNETAQAQ